MKRMIINIIVTIVCIATTVTFMDYSFFSAFMNLGEWTFKNIQKFLAFEFQSKDHVLVQISPLFFIYPIVRYKLNYWREIFLMTFIGICTISTSLIAGIAIALYTWRIGASNQHLPDYILEQPFGNYWTVFILIGILTPIAILILKNTRTTAKLVHPDLDM